MKRKRWKIISTEPVTVRRLAETLSVSEPFARILAARGLCDPQDARRFLKPDISHLHDPFELPDMNRAVNLVLEAGRTGKKIVIYGDYDADGVSAIALLLEFFRLAGFAAGYYVPHRTEEGYGLNEAAVRYIAEQKAELLLTVDCGTSDSIEVELARKSGMKVVITDHHEVSEVLPQADAFVNPKVPSSRYPFHDLSGVGVAFKLVEAMSQRLPSSFRRTPEFREFLLNALGLVALGTISDVSPLIGENRVLAYLGLDALRVCENHGLVALLNQAGLQHSRISADDVGFKIGPRINAAGRLGQSSLGVELLTTRSAARAQEIAATLEKANRERQRIEEEILARARDRIKKEVDLEEECAIVLSGTDWHPGVVGIVGARLVEEFHRPAILICEGRGVARGSGRSIESVPLHECLSKCSDLLKSYGGHWMAAGLEIDPRNIPTFKKRFLDTVRQWVAPADLVETITIDCEVPLSSVTKSLVEEMSLLEPHGHGNSRPAMATKGMRLTAPPRRVGKRGEHLQFHVNQGRTTVQAIAFGMGQLHERLASSSSISLAYTPRINLWQGLISVELDVKDIQLQ